MLDYDSEFLKFSNRLGENNKLFDFRDMLFSSFFYKMIGWKPLLRNKFGMFSWIPWAVLKAKSFQNVANTTAKVADMDILISGHYSAHWMNLRPLVESAIGSGRHVRLWVQDLHDDTQDILWKDCEVANIHQYFRTHRASFLSIVCIVLSCLYVSRKCGFFIFGKKTSQMADALLSYSIWNAAWKHIFKNNKCLFAVVSSEGSPYNKAFVHAAKEAGAHIIHICHGLPFESHAVTNASDLFAFSTIDAQWFRKRINSSTRIHSIGNPRMLQIRRIVLPNRRRIINSPLRILFLSNGVENPYTIEHESQDMAILKLPPEIKKLTVLRVRPHPRENRNDLEASLRSNSLDYDELSSETLAADLSWADVCATPWSTSLLEAIVCEIACFWINARNDGLVGTIDYIKSGIGTLVTNSSDWSKVIESILLNPQAIDKYCIRKQRLQEFGFLPNNDELNWYDEFTKYAAL